jgi:hypothetical protein
MILKILILIPMFLISCRNLPHKTDVVIQIIKVEIYKDFQKKGFTSASAYSHFDDLEMDGIEKITVSNQDKMKLEQILNRSKRKKHLQIKFGTTNLFSEIFFKESNNAHRVVFTGPTTFYDKIGSVKQEFSFITDLSKMVDFEITNKNDLKWLVEFRNKFK